MGLTRRVFIAGGAHTPYIGKHHPDFIWAKHPDFGTRENPTYDALIRASVEAIDDLTVRYTFDPAGALREALLTAAGLPVFSRAYYETRDFAESTLEPPVGSGPYLLGEV